MEKENLINKIRALQAKAESSEHPAEKEAFAAKATELLTRYQISTSDLEETKEIGHVYFLRRGLKNATYGYCQLFWGIAPLFRCAALASVSELYDWEEGRNVKTASIWLYGAADDIEMVRALVDDLLCPQMMAAVLRDKPRSRKSYVAGWATRIAIRLAQAQHDFCEEQGALIPTNTEARKAAEAASSGSTKTVLDSDSVGAGYKAANNADLGQTRLAKGNGLLSA